MNRKLAFSLLLGAFAVSSWAQQAVTVKGTVKDAENNPVIGATVVVKGTTIGTTTDIDGNYTINVQPRTGPGIFLRRYATFIRYSWQQKHN